MAETSKQRHRDSKSKFIVTLLMHQFVGTFGVIALAGMLTYIAFEFPSPLGRPFTINDIRGVLTGTPYFPAQIVVALLTGWLLGELFAHDSMLWIWVLPYTWLVYDFARLPTVQRMPFPTRLSYFFGWGCRAEDDCIYQIGVALPFYVAVAYSSGALLARKLPMRSPVARRKVSGIIFIIGVLILADELKAFAFNFRQLLSMTPRGWGWILLPTGALDAGIGACFIFFALKIRRVRPDLAEREPLSR
jgi:hypothetical protein